MYFRIPFCNIYWHLRFKALIQGRLHCGSYLTLGFNCLNREWHRICNSGFSLVKPLSRLKLESLPAFFQRWTAYPITMLKVFINFLGGCTRMKPSKCTAVSFSCPNCIFPGSKWRWIAICHWSRINQSGQLGSIQRCDQAKSAHIFTHFPLSKA